MSVSGVEAIVCGDCGSANEGDVSFCGSCGAYLEWEGQAVGPEPEPEPEPDPGPEPEPEAPDKPSLLHRVKAGLGIEQTGADPATGVVAREPSAGGPAAPEPVASEPATAGRETAEREAAELEAADREVAVAPATPAPSPPRATPAVAPARPAPGSPATAQPAPVPAATAQPAPASAAARLVTPVEPGSGAPAAGAARQPVAVKPGAEARPAPKKKLPVQDRRPQPGETVCRECGAGNAPDRKFCRRCGTDLADAVVVAPLPWWRRLLRRRPETAPVAGTRPVRRRRRLPGGGLLRLLLVVAAVLVVLRLTWVWVGVPVEAVRDRLSGNAVVNPSAIAASSAFDGHPAALARDGATNTFWAPAKTADPSGEFVEASFPSPFRLVAVQVFNGSSEQPKPYLSTARVATFLLTAVKDDGSIETRSVTLADVPGKQDFTMGISDVTTVRITVQTAYGAGPQVPVALAEVAFFKRS
ncbi:MAG: zinc-ribbon domain-containing protein [Dermatophilaceae bacterium]